MSCWQHFWHMAQWIDRKLISTRQDKLTSFFAISYRDRDTKFSITRDIPIPLQSIYPIKQSLLHMLRMSVHIVCHLFDRRYIIQNTDKPLWYRDNLYRHFSSFRNSFGLDNSFSFE